MKENLALIIDSNCIGHIAKHSMQGLSYDEKATGVIFGFMQHVLRFAQKFETNKFAFCWDSRKSYRKEKYELYKYKRHNKKNKEPEDIVLDEMAHQQFYELRQKVLIKFGFSNVFQYTGYEADDIMASIVKNNKKFKMIIVTHDEDLFQMLPYAEIYNPRKKELIGANTFIKYYGIKPEQWPEVKAIAGCSTDGVKGFYNVAEKTAIKYLTGKLKKGKALQDIIKDVDNIIPRNRELVTLPYKGMPVVHIDFRTDEFSLSAFEILCNTYGFRTFKKDINVWNKAFRMKV